MRFYDLSDAFHSCAATEDTQDLLVVKFNSKYYQYTGGAQGITNMAIISIYWNVHLMNMTLFDKVLAEHWQEWYTLYVNELRVIGATEIQVKTRACVRGNTHCHGEAIFR